MLKSKMLINVLLVLTILFCFYLIDNSIAGDCDDMSSGAGSPTVTGNHNYPENWNPDLQYDPNNPDEIDPNSSIPINVIGGCPPYILSISGNGFSMTGNTLFANDTACGTATITVTDYCGNNATGYVRCTTGAWSVAKNDCIGCPSSAGITCEIIEGNKKYFTKTWCGGTAMINDLCPIYCDPSGGLGKSCGDCQFPPRCRSGTECKGNWKVFRSYYQTWDCP